MSVAARLRALERAHVPRRRLRAHVLRVRAAIIWMEENIGDPLIAPGDPDADKCWWRAPYPPIPAIWMAGYPPCRLTDLIDPTQLDQQEEAILREVARLRAEMEEVGNESR